MKYIIVVMAILLTILLINVVARMAIFLRDAWEIAEAHRDVMKAIEKSKKAKEPD